MGFPMVDKTPLQCSFGAAPGALSVNPAGKLSVLNQKVATIDDTKFIPPAACFGVCSSALHPGNPPPKPPAAPCAPVVVKWAPLGAPKLTVGGVPVATADYMLNCAYGGIIKAVAPTQAKLKVP